jgi:hypothetical protein
MRGPGPRVCAIGSALAWALGVATPARADAATDAAAGGQTAISVEDELDAAAGRQAAVSTDSESDSGTGLGHAPTASSAPSVAGAAQSEPTAASCEEHIPEGKQRPRLSEKLPDRGLSGHVAWLRIEVEHGKGETVLPDRLSLQSSSEQMRALERAGFVLPDPEGGVAPTVERREQGERAQTTVRIPVVLLPAEPGRQSLRLPPLPLAIARASGEVMTLCTRPHSIVVEDPIANDADAKPKDNPPARRQLEEWTTAKHVAYASLAALLIGALAAWLVGKWLRRPRPAPPPPPPRPPWEVALEELHDIRLAGLVDAGRFAEQFDRVSFAIRRYLGDRYGFDGLESTTREILGVLRRVVPPVAVLPQIQTFLRHADLVKFARLTPTAAECREALEQGEHIVRKTIPAFEPSAGAAEVIHPPAPGGGSPEGPDAPAQTIQPDAGGPGPEGAGGSR